MSPQPTSVYDIIDDLQEPAVFYGDSNAIRNAMRESAYAYLEIPAEMAGNQTLGAIPSINAETPVHVLFTDFGSANEPTSESIITFVKQHDTSKGVAIAHHNGPTPDDNPRTGTAQAHVAEDETECRPLTGDNDANAARAP